MISEYEDALAAYAGTLVLPIGPSERNAFDAGWTAALASVSTHLAPVTAPAQKIRLVAYPWNDAAGYQTEPGWRLHSVVERGSGVFLLVLVSEA